MRLGAEELACCAVGHFAWENRLFLLIGDSDEGVCLDDELRIRDGIPCFRLQANLVLELSYQGLRKLVTIEG